jgi:hypothetical protein
MEMKGCFAHSLAQACSFTGQPIHVIILLIQSSVCGCGTACLKMV